MSSSLPCSLLRQFLFCPRIPYYVEVLGIRPHQPLWVRQGVDWHKRQELLSRNRTLTRYGLLSARKVFQCHLESETMGIHGIADLVLLTDKEVIPVEFKQGAGPLNKGGHVQLTAYGMLAEEHYGRPFLRSFVLSGEKAQAESFPDTPERRQTLQHTIAGLRTVLDSPLLPDSSASHPKCGQCEYLAHCNDRF